MGESRPRSSRPHHIHRLIRMARQTMGRCLSKIIASAHAFDSTLSIYDSLLAGVERMTLATNFDTYCGLGPTCIEYVPARASYS